eukprot:TRINITY_DN10933_c0_g2_i1.p1 TRINITY_DN10933_c0_g2~~TRINITY_DN10933_c0_g2_i1.p1  ORF type:complete len:476 (+),score=79.86 TRINITY_DN10933_c0_g2_i1:41-1468(+)
MGCGASSDSVKRSDKYLETNEEEKKDGKGSPPREEAEVLEEADEVVAPPKYTTSSLVMKYRKGVKLGDIPDEEVETRRALWELITGQRVIPKQPGKIPVSITTDFGKVHLGMDEDGITEVTEAEDAIDVTGLLTKRSLPARVKRINVTMIKGHPKSIRVAVLSPNDWLLVSTDASIGSNESSARVTDIRQQVICGSLDGRRRECFDSAVDASFTVDGALLATVHRMEAVLVWDMNTFRVKKTMTFSEDEQGEVRMILVRMSPCSKLLAVGVEMFDDEGGTNGCVLVFEMNGRLVTKYDGSPGTICSLAFSPSGKSVACGSNEGRIAIFESRSGEELHQIEGHSTPIRSMCYSPDGTKIITCDERTVAAWDSETMEPIWARVLGGGEVHESTIPRILSMGARKNPAPAVRHTCASFCPGGLIMLGRTDRMVQFLTLQSGAEFHCISTRSPVTKITPGCRKVAMGDLFGNLYVVDVL